MIHVPSKLGFTRFKNDGKKAPIWKFGNDVDSKKWFAYFGVLKKMNLSLYADESCCMLRASYDLRPNSALSLEEKDMGGKTLVIALEVIRTGDALSLVHFSSPDPDDQQAWYEAFDEARHRGFRPVSQPPVGDSFYPKLALQVEYASDSGQLAVDDGNVISSKLLLNAPTIRYDIFHQVVPPLYLLLMVDCDAVKDGAAPATAARQMFVHWTVANIRKYELDEQVRACV
jgi:hypothetical protein